MIWFTRKISILALILIVFQLLYGEKKPTIKKKVNYPISKEDSEYLENFRRTIGITDNSDIDIRTFSIIAYQDDDAGKIKILNDKYFEIHLDVLPIPYIGKYFKNLISIDEYARFYNVWKDSIHIQEEKRGVYFYKILPDGSHKLTKYYGDRKRRKRKEGKIFNGDDIISLINNKMEGSILKDVKTFAFGFPYFGEINDYGDSVSLDPTKFYVVESRRIIPIIDDKNIPIKDLYIKFNEKGDFIEGGCLIKKGFDTNVTIKELHQ